VAKRCTTRGPVSLKRPTSPLPHEGDVETLGRAASSVLALLSKWGGEDATIVVDYAHRLTAVSNPFGERQELSLLQGYHRVLSQMTQLQPTPIPVPEDPATPTVAFCSVILSTTVATLGELELCRAYDVIWILDVEKKELRLLYNSTLYSERMADTFMDMMTPPSTDSSN